MMIWNLCEDLEYFIIWDNSQIKYYVIVILVLVETKFTFRVSTGHCPQSEISTKSLKTVKLTIDHIFMVK